MGHSSTALGTEAIDHVLLDERTISGRVRDLASTIAEDYRGVDALVLVGVLRGAFIFLADLARALTLPNHIDFIALSSYRLTSTNPGAVRLIMDTRTNLAERHVLLVEDIVDTGHTLAYLQRILSARNPASLRTCVLLSKPDRREVEVSIDYLGFEIPDVWVVGYGLDFDDQFRTLPYIAALNPEKCR
jgi:hypoxanthine phosphoribosyltransferase